MKKGIKWNVIYIFIFVSCLFIAWFFLASLEQRSLYYPAARVEGTPADVGIAYENVFIRTSDGVTLHGWFVPVDPARGTVLFFHGNAGNISHRLHRVDFFRRLGVNLLLVDYRGYGRSTGKPGERGLYRDAEAAYQYLCSKIEIPADDIIFYGKSLGGAVAAELSLRHEPRALVLESTFTSTAAMGREVYPFLPVGLIVRQNFDTLAKVGRIRAPKLILHGRQDEIIPFRHGVTLHDAAVPPKKFIPFAGGHNDERYVVSDEYLHVLAEFLNRE